MQTLHDKQPLGPLSLRYGLALTLLWSVLTKFTHTDTVVAMTQALGFSFMNKTIIIVIAIGLLVLAILLIWGKYLHIVGILLALFFLVTILAAAAAGDAPFSVGPAIWKDFTLLGAALYFVFTGEGESCCKQK